MGAALNVAAPVIQGFSERRVAFDNARIADRAADDAIDRGRFNVRNLHRRYGRLRGAQRVGYGASGFLVDSGSALDVEMDLDSQLMQDVLVTRMNAAREAWGYEKQARDLRREGARAVTRGFIGGGTALMGEAEKFTKAAAGGGGG